MEKDIALTLACKVQEHLKKIGVKSFLTRSNDEGMPLSMRSTRAFKGKADLYVSLHANSAGAAQEGIEALCLKKGTRTEGECGHLFINTPATERYGEIIDNFFKNNIARSHRLAHSILSNMVDHTKKSMITVKNRGLKCNAWQTLLHNNDIPSTIVEAGFLTSPKEGALLQDSVYQELLTYSIAQGIVRFMKLEQLI